MAAMWRQEAALHPAFQRFNQSLNEDWFLLPHELRLQRAHAEALLVSNLIDDEERAAIDAALRDIDGEYADRPCPQSDAEDLHTWIESELIRRAGVAGRKIHTARSRNDQVATLLKLYVIASGGHLANDLEALVRLSCERAQEWAEIPMPLHTHQQFAAPGNAGFWLLRFAVSWDRMLRHVRFLVGEWRRHCPLGSGAVAGSSLAVNRQVQAEGLGFAGPSINALESTGCRDDCIELINLGAQLALHLQCLAADVILFSQTPLQWVVYPAGFGTGSSMMPNKLNPDAMELLRGEANAIVGAQAQAALLLKGLPSGYNRDLQCIKPLVRDVVERLHALCVLTLEFIGQLQFDPAKAAASTRAGAISATLAMEAKVREGLALRDAHHATAAEVAAGKLACSGTAADWIAAYQTAGSASPVETRSAARQILAGLEG